MGVPWPLGLHGELDVPQRSRERSDDAPRMRAPAPALASARAFVGGRKGLEGLEGWGLLATVELAVVVKTNLGSHFGDWVNSPPILGHCLVVGVGTGY